jgi:hypothetical protein
MSAEAYISITEQTLWEDRAMQDQSMDELIEDARAILDEISSRIFRPLHSAQESGGECEITSDEAGEPSKRRSFVPEENGLKPTNHGRAWTEEDIDMAKAFKLAGWSYSKIAKHFGRNTNGVRKMLRRK